MFSYDGFMYSMCHICQPTVSEISHETVSYLSQVLLLLCPMAPLSEIFIGYFLEGMNIRDIKKFIFRKFCILMFSYDGFMYGVCHICQPTVSEISHETVSDLSQVLFLVCSMAPLLENFRGYFLEGLSSE